MSVGLGQIDYGTDVSSFPDLDPSFGPLSGNVVIAQATARRLMTPRGTLPDAPNYGTDIRQYLNESMGTGGMTPTQIKNAVESECLQDERVSAADAAVYFNPQTYTMNVTLSVTPSQGPAFKFVLNVTAVTITLLSTG